MLEQQVANSQADRPGVDEEHVQLASPVLEARPGAAGSPTTAMGSMIFPVQSQTVRRKTTSVRAELNSGRRLWRKSWPQPHAPRSGEQREFVDHDGPRVSADKPPVSPSPCEPEGFLTILRQVGPTACELGQEESRRLTRGYYYCLAYACTEQGLVPSDAGNKDAKGGGRHRQQPRACVGNILPKKSFSPG